MRHKAKEKKMLCFGFALQAALSGVQLIITKIKWSPGCHLVIPEVKWYCNLSLLVIEIFRFLIV